MAPLRMLGKALIPIDFTATTKGDAAADVPAFDATKRPSSLDDTRSEMQKTPPT